MLVLLYNSGSVTRRNWSLCEESNSVPNRTKVGIIHKCFRGIVCFIVYFVALFTDNVNNVQKYTQLYNFLYKVGAVTWNRTMFHDLRGRCIATYALTALFGTDHRSRTCMTFPPLRSKRSVYTIPPDRHCCLAPMKGIEPS